MTDGGRDDPCLSDHELQALALIEVWLALEDPALDHRLRTGRRMPRRVNPVHAGIGVAVIAPIVSSFLLVTGPVVGVIAAAIGAATLPVWLLLSARVGPRR